jgi:hypothetical protein
MKEVRTVTAGKDGDRKQVEARGPGTGLLTVALFLLSGTALLLVWVGMGAVRASKEASVRAGLEYEDFLGAVDELIHDAGESTLLAFDPLEERLPGGRTVRFDTLRILADLRSFPAFQRGGFLYDQVLAYNRFQRERLDLAQTDPTWWDRLAGFNPSVFRSYARADGSPGLTRAPEVWSLRILPPLEGSWSGEVQAADVARAPGLLSPRVDVPLSRPARLVLPLEGRNQPCEFVPSPPEVRVYCLSEERIAQATLRLEEGGRRSGWARAGWAHVWVDGERVSPGDSAPLPMGSLLRLEPMDPVVLGEYWEGVLSSEQWVNGRMRRRGTVAPPLDFLAGLGTAPAGVEEPEDLDAMVRVSVRAGASQDLTRRLQAFLDSEVALPLDFGTAVIARLPDGEILAVAEVGERRNRGRSSLLERMAPGSAVKPLLAAAILSQRPELASLTIPPRSGPVRSVFGMPPTPARWAFTTALNCPPPREGRVGLEYFLRCSNNEYAATLLIAGLDEAKGSDSRGPSPTTLGLQGSRVPRAILLRSPLSKGLSEVFDLPTDPTIADRRSRSARVWEGMAYSDGTPLSVPHELLPSESRPALLAPGEPEGTDLGLLYRYAMGAWENQWTLLDLTNGFGRVVTDTRMSMGFAPRRRGDASSEPEALGFGGEPWYERLLAGLRGVGVDGTAAGLSSAWEQEGLPAQALFKTGTLNEPGEASHLDDLFAKSLLFAVGEGSAERRGPLKCGLVGGLYLRFQEGPRNGNLPSYQVAFAGRELGEFLRDHWDEFGVCGGGPGNVP